MDTGVGTRATYFHYMTECRVGDQQELPKHFSQTKYVRRHSKGTDHIPAEQRPSTIHLIPLDI